jgi:hypothetical protein
MGGRNRPDVIYATHRNIAGKFSSSIFNENSRPAAESANMGRNFTAATLALHSLYVLNARLRRAFGDFPVLGCQPLPFADQRESHND